MKLNNLSRLTALLLALMLLPLHALATGTSLDDLTGDMLDTYDTVAEFVEAGYCEVCAGSLYSESITEWPIAEYTCLYDHLKGFASASASYDYLTDLFYDEEGNGYDLYWAYMSSHNTHVIDHAYEIIICYDEFDCYSSPIVQPGAANHDESCPWHDEEYTVSTPVTSSPDVSTPDALKTATTITLTFTADGESLTYTWQQGTLAADGTLTWADIADAASTSYELTVTAGSIQYAYRCVVTNDAGTIVATSDPFYLGGEGFFGWVYSTVQDVNGADLTSIAAWLNSDYAPTVEIACLAYDELAAGVTLDEAIAITADSKLLALYEGAHLADLVDGQLVDTRYHIVVAELDSEGNIVTLTTD